MLYHSLCGLDLRFAMQIDTLVPLPFPSLQTGSSKGVYILKFLLYFKFPVEVKLFCQKYQVTIWPKY